MAFKEYTIGGGRTRPLYKMRIEKEELESALVLGGTSLHGFLGRFARRCFGRYGLSGPLDRGHPKFIKNSRGSRSAKSGIPFGTSGSYPQMLCLNTQHPYP